MKLIPDDVAKYYQINSLKRGHEVFTSLIIYGGRILFLEDHIKRLLQGADFLFPQIGWNHKHQQVTEVVINSCAEMVGNFYLRVTIFDDSIHLEKKVLEQGIDHLKLAVAQKRKSLGLNPAFLKSSNYLDADLEILLAKSRHFDDVLFLDTSEMVTEASSSNIFIVTADNKILTPPSSSMVLEGILKKNLIDMLPEFGLKVEEECFSRSTLFAANEIWLTNSVRGIRFVTQLEEKTFQRSNSHFNLIIKSFGIYGELL